MTRSSRTNPTAGARQPTPPTVAQRLSREQLRARVTASVSIAKMNDAGQDAMRASDDDKKIEYLKTAKELGEKASENLALLTATTPDDAAMKQQNNMLRAQVRLELATIYRKKYREQSLEDKKIEFLTLEKHENESALEIFNQLPESLQRQPHLQLVLKQMTEARFDNYNNLASCYRDKGIKIENDDVKESIALFTLAAQANKEASKITGAFIPANNKNQVIWAEWVIRCDLETGRFRWLSQLEQDAGEALQELNLTSPDHQEKKEPLLAEFHGKVKLLLKENEAAVSQLNDLQKMTATLRDNRKLNNALWTSTTDKNRAQCNLYPDKIRAKLATIAISSAIYKALRALAQLGHVKKTSSTDIHDLVEDWERQHEAAILSMTGTFCSLFNLDDEKNTAALPITDKYKVLASLVSQLKEKEFEAQWMASLCTRNTMPKHAKLIKALEACCKELGKAAENELINTKTKLNKKEKKEIPAQHHHQQSWSFELIETKFDGKLVGSRDGNFVVTKDYNGKVTRYRQEGDVWVRDAKHEAVDEAVTELEEKEDVSAIASQQEKMPQTTTKGLEAAKGKLATLQKEIEQSAKLSQFILDQQGPFSQFDAIFSLAVEKQEHAVNVLTRTIERLAKLESPSEPLMKEMKELETDLHNRKTWLANTQSERINAAKTLPPSGRTLDFLLEAGQIEDVKQTVTRKKLRGVTITSLGVTTSDYLDEHTIFLKGSKQTLILHTHFSKQDARLEEKTASHLKFTADDEDVRNQVSLEILEKLHSRGVNRFM